jgi:hypothetical protein
MPVGFFPDAYRWSISNDLWHRIHSDLDGISRIEFDSSVTEKIDEIERELLGAGGRE